VAIASCLARSRSASNRSSGLPSVSLRRRTPSDPAGFGGGGAAHPVQGLGATSITSWMPALLNFVDGLNGR
jgi:hypothetical protein